MAAVSSVRPLASFPMRKPIVTGIVLPVVIIRRPLKVSRKQPDTRGLDLIRTAEIVCVEERHAEDGPWWSRITFGLLDIRGLPIHHHAGDARALPRAQNRPQVARVLQGFKDHEAGLGRRRFTARPAACFAARLCRRFAARSPLPPGSSSSRR